MASVRLRHTESGDPKEGISSLFVVIVLVVVVDDALALVSGSLDEPSAAAAAATAVEEDSVLKVQHGGPWMDDKNDRDGNTKRGGQEDEGQDLCRMRPFTVRSTPRILPTCTKQVLLMLY